MLTHALRCLLLMVLAVPAAVAQSPGDRMYVGQDVFVASGQEVHNAVCLFCSVQVEGELTGHVIVLFGSMDLMGQVKGGALVVGGNAVVDSQARVGGDTVVLDGNAVYETDESLSGNAYVLGGHLSRVARAEGSRQKRVSLSPMIFGVLGVVVLVLLVGAVVARLRRRATVSQPL